MRGKKLLVGVTLVIVLIVGVGKLWSDWRDGKFVQLQGSLIISAPTNAMPWGHNLKSGSVQQIALGKQYETKPFFQDASYDEVRFSQQKESSSIFSARNVEGNYYTVLSVKNGIIRELMKSDTPVFYPSIHNHGNEIIFFSRKASEPWQYYLYQHDLQKRESKRLVDVPVVWWSMPMFSSTGDIYFAAIGKHTVIREQAYLKEGTMIKRLSPNGEVKNIGYGIFPVWLEEDKAFFYYDLGPNSLFVKNLENSTSRLVAKDTRIDSQPVLSPNKKYMAFHELRDITNGKDATIFLVVMSIDGWEKLTLTRPGFNSFISGAGDISWAPNGQKE